MANNYANSSVDRNRKHTTVDVLMIGGGPATLGLLINASKNGKLHELIASGDGIGIVEKGLTFGGGVLQDFGINSNTSANGFIRGLYKAKETVTTVAPEEKKSPAKKDEYYDEEADDYDEEGEAEDWVEDDEEEAPTKVSKKEYIALNPFKDLYKHTPLIQMAFEFG
jgi:hypothetical protein